MDARFNANGPTVFLQLDDVIEIPWDNTSAMVMDVAWN
jgi:hypothetical protein